MTATETVAVRDHAPTATERFSRILDDGDLVSASDLQHVVHSRHIAVEINDDDRFGSVGDASRE